MNKMKLRVCLTDRCNFNCEYCRSGGEGIAAADTLSQDELLKILNYLSEYGFEAIRLTGGEPLLRKDWFELASKLTESKKFSKITLVTNGSLLTKNNINKIKKSSFKSLTVSLDTIIPSEFCEISGVNCLQSVMDGIELLKLHNVNVKINSVVSKRNIENFWTLIKYCETKKINMKVLDLVEMDSSYWRKEYFLLTDLENELMKQSTNINLQYQDEGFGTPEHVYSYGDIKIVIKNSALGTCYTNICKSCKNYPCQSGIVSMLLTHNGYLKLCSLNDDYLIDTKPLLQGNKSTREQIKNFIEIYNSASFEKEAWKNWKINRSSF